MAIDTEKLLLEIYGTVQEIKARLDNMENEQKKHRDGMSDFETRLSRLERIVYAGIAIVAIVEPIILEILKHYIDRL
jgi:DNA repair photolyase